MNEKIKLVSFIGFSGSGKSYEANKLIEQGYVEVRMSERVQEIVAKQLGQHDEMLKDCNKWWDKIKFQKFVYQNIVTTPKLMINKLTESVNEIDLTFWFRDWEYRVNEVINYYDEIEKELPGIVVTDSRYYSSLPFLFRDYFDTKVIFTDYISDRYSPQDGITENLITYLITNHQLKHLDDITSIIHSVSTACK
jgi:hypothetical protein